MTRLAPVQLGRAGSLGDFIATRAREVVLTTLQGAPVEVEIRVINRGGDLVGREDFE